MSKSNNKALHIGINYVGTSHALYGCINDTITMKNLTLNYLPANRRLILTDESKYKPNKKNVERAFRWLRCKNCDNTGLWSCSHNENHSPGTTLYFTYSGHGSRVWDNNGDEVDNIDETIYLLDGHMTDDYIFSNLIYPVPQGVRLWTVLDCCHSSTGADLQFSFNDIQGNKFTMNINNNKLCKGEIIMVSGCLDSGTSADAWIDGKSQGALSASIANIIGEIPHIRILGMFNKLRQYMSENSYKQKPTVSFGGVLNLSASFFYPL